jgi:hypothetical protein
MTGVSRWLVIASCSSVLLHGCAEHARRSMQDGTAESAGDAGPTELLDESAGRACASDSDCAPGRCADSLQIYADSEPMAAPGGYCTTSCARDSQCGREGECVVPAGAERGECLAACAQDEACREGYFCAGAGRALGIDVLGTCRPRAEVSPLADSVVGRACTDDADCGRGRCAAQSPLGTSFPGNYCTGRCLQDAECGAGGVCLVHAGSSDAGHCFARCAADVDCARDGYRCRELGSGVDACYPAVDPLPDRGAGRACSADLDCGSGTARCAVELPFRNFADYESIAAPGGYCTQECSLHSDCGAGGSCVSHGTEGGLCLASCAAEASDCREGYACLPARDTDLDAGVCVPAE